MLRLSSTRITGVEILAAKESSRALRASNHNPYKLLKKNINMALMVISKHLRLLDLVAIPVVQLKHRKAHLLMDHFFLRVPVSQ
jgi:hypothetical protein